MNKDLFTQFYEKNFKKLINHIKKAKFPHASAEDLAQSIMLELLTNYDDEYLKDEAMFWFFANLRILNAKEKFMQQEALLRHLANRQEVNNDAFYDVIEDLKKNPDYEMVIRLLLALGKKKAAKVVGRKKFKRIFKEMIKKVQEEGIL